MKFRANFKVMMTDKMMTNYNFKEQLPYSKMMTNCNFKEQPPYSMTMTLAHP